MGKDDEKGAQRATRVEQHCDHCHSNTIKCKTMTPECVEICNLQSNMIKHGTCSSFQIKNMP